MFGLFKRRREERPPGGALVRVGPGDKDWITAHQAMENIFIIGGIGSGKTSGPGDAIARAMLALGWGFLVLAAKVDEFARWEKLCGQAGRGGDLIRFSPEGGLCCNPIDVELNCPGGSVERATAMIEYVVEAANRKGGTQQQEQFWAGGLHKLSHNIIQTVHLAKGTCTVADMDKVLRSAPTSRDQARDERWMNNSFLVQHLRAASLKEDLKREVGLLYEFWGEEWVDLSDKPRSIFATMLGNVTSKFMQQPLYGMTCGKSTVGPGDVLAGKVLVLDFPYLRYREMAQFFQVMMKTITQRAALGRDYAHDMLPVVVWADECQLFQTDQDAATLAVSRQARCPHVSITQTLPGLYSALGGNEKAKLDGESFIAGHMTKIFCSNSCPTTNRFASELCGHSLQELYGGSFGLRPYDALSDMMGLEGMDQSGNVSHSQQWLPDLQPVEFAKLGKGGDENGRLVETITFQGGRRFSSGKQWVRGGFIQRY
jgi:hypothetical protein